MNYVQNPLGLAGMFLPSSQGGVLQSQQPYGIAQPKNNNTNNTGMYEDPFGTAMSGNQENTLQPYLNKQNANAYRALYGGLLGYAPQDMTAGNATGGATTASGAQMQMPSSMQGLLAGAGGQLAQTGQLDPLQLALQNRSWMKG